FRVLGGIRRLKFYNVGLYGRGRQLSFRMFAGSDVAEAMSPATQAGTTKSNVFGVGYRAGESVDIGVSQKGTFWSMATRSVPEWRVWCRSLAEHVLDESIATNAFLAHTLVPK